MDVEYFSLVQLFQKYTKHRSQILHSLFYFFSKIPLGKCESNNYKIMTTIIIYSVSAKCKEFTFCCLSHATNPYGKLKLHPFTEEAEALKV